MQNPIKTAWTKQEVVEIVSALVLKRHGLTFDEYIELITSSSQKIDHCQDSDVIGLLALIGLGNGSLATA
jgi:hypothetical protein